MNVRFSTFIFFYAFNPRRWVSAEKWKVLFSAMNLRFVIGFHEDLRGSGFGSKARQS